MSDSPTTLFTVYWARRTGVAGIAAIYSDGAHAATIAREWSRQTGIVYAAVTSFVLDQEGTRTAVVWFVDGKRQHTPWPTDELPPIDHQAADAEGATCAPR